jgi:O-antigen ligase
MYRSPMTERTDFYTQETKPQLILSFLPFTLFFPIGVGYAGILLFIVALLLNGDHRAKWQAVKSSPLFWPTLGLLLVTCGAGLFLTRPDGFWKAFLHYQNYLVLLLFISVGGGRWQQRALYVFFGGAVYAATLFYLNYFQLLPDWAIFQNYIQYAGNKSILVGILLGIAGGWMLNEICTRRDGRLLMIAAFLYIAFALFVFAKTRTGSIIFILTCAVVILRYLTLSRRSLLMVFGVALLIGGAWQNASDFRTRLTGTVQDVKAFMQGGQVSAEGVRLEMYRITGEIIMDRPLAGHGIGTWVINYEERAQGLLSQTMATPHNDYLLYAAEIGIIGVLALLWIWVTQLVVAVRIGGDNGVRLFAIGVAIMFGGMVNAIMRDALFGIAFMLLLAIPLAGISRSSYRQRHY